MSNLLSERSKALIRLILDSQLEPVGTEGPPGPKTQIAIREARNEVGLATTREHVYYAKVAAEWNA